MSNNKRKLLNPAERDALTKARDELVREELARERSGAEAKIARLRALRLGQQDSLT